MRVRSIVVASVLTAIVDVVRAAPDPQVAPGVDYTAIECLRVVQSADRDASPERRQGVEYCVAYLALRTRRIRELLDGAEAPVAAREPASRDGHAPGEAVAPVAAPVAAGEPEAAPTSVDELVPAAPAAPEPRPAMRADPVPAPQPGGVQPHRFLEGF